MDVLSRAATMDREASEPAAPEHAVNADAADATQPPAPTDELAVMLEQLAEAIESEAAK